MDASGSSDALFRLGDDLLVRLPRQPGGAETITKEARWLPYVAGGLPVATPEVVAVGEPDLGYPERWSVVRWLDGQTPTVPAGPAEVGGLACALAEVVGSLGGLTVPADGLEDPALRWYRGEPLTAMDVVTRAYLAQCRKLPGLDLDVDASLHVWDAAMALPDADRVVSPRWLRGRAWALAIAAMTFPYYADTVPDRCAARLTMARAVLADAAGRSPKGP